MQSVHTFRGSWGNKKWSRTDSSKPSQYYNKDIPFKWTSSQVLNRVHDNNHNTILSKTLKSSDSTHVNSTGGKFNISFYTWNSWLYMYVVGPLLFLTWMMGGCFRRVGWPTNRTLSIFSSNFFPHISDLVARMVARMMSENLKEGKKSSMRTMSRVWWEVTAPQQLRQVRQFKLAVCLHLFTSQRVSMTAYICLNLCGYWRGEKRKRTPGRNSEVAVWMKNVKDTCWLDLRNSCCNQKG